MHNMHLYVHKIYFMRTTYTSSSSTAFQRFLALAVAMIALVVVLVAGNPLQEVKKASAAASITTEALDCVSFQCPNGRSTAVDAAGNIWVVAQATWNNDESIKNSSLVKIANTGTAANPVYLASNVTTTPIGWTLSLKTDSFGNVWYIDKTVNPAQIVQIDSSGTTSRYSGYNPWSFEINQTSGDLWISTRVCQWGVKKMTRAANGTYSGDISSTSNCRNVWSYPQSNIRTGNGSALDSDGNLWYMYYAGSCNTASGNGGGYIQKIDTASFTVSPAQSQSYCPPTGYTYNKWLVADAFGNVITGNNTGISITTPAKIQNKIAPVVIESGSPYRAAAAPNGDIWTMTQGCGGGISLAVISPTGSGHALYAARGISQSTSCSVAAFNTTIDQVATDAYSRFVIPTSSAIVIATALHLPKLDTPTSVAASATASTVKSVDVSWPTVANASSYKVKIYDSAGTTSLGTKTGVSGTSTTITASTYASIADNTSYKVSVQAIGDAVSYDDSTESSQVAVTTNINAVAPTISSQPASAFRTSGQSVTMTVTASASDGGTVTYAWKKAGVAISGEVNSTLAISSVAISDAASYTVVVTNTLSNGVATSTTSSAATLTVAGALSIATPTTGLSGTAHSAFSLAVGGSGGRASLTYSLTGTLVSGLSFGTSTGSISGTPSATWSSTVSVSVTDANGATAATSNFTISVGYASTTVSLALASASPQYRLTNRITATTSRAGTVNFMLGGTSIVGCEAVAAAATTATCDWVPVDLGLAALSAEFTPTTSTYSNSTTSLSPTVLARAITVTPTAGQSKVFGGTDSVIAYSITSGSMYGSETLTGALSRVPGEDAGTYSITGGTLSNANYAITLTPVNFTISQANQDAVVLSTTSGVYATGLTLAASGGLGTGAYSFAVTSTGTAGCSITSGVLNATSPGSCTVTATRALSTNYVAASSVATTVTIGKATQAVVTLTTTSGTFNTNISLSASGGTSSGGYSYAVTDTGSAGCSLATSTMLRSSGAGTCTVTATRAGDSNYESKSSAATTVTFARDSQNLLSVRDVAGDLDTGITLSVSGGSGTGAVSYSVTSGTASCSVTSGVVMARFAGSCLLTTTKAGDSNYSQAQITNTLTFIKATQSLLQITSVSGVYGTPIALTISGGSGSGALTYSVSDAGTASCSVSGSLLSFTSVGSYRVTATRDADSIFDSRSSASTTITIDRANQPALSTATTSGDLVTGIIVSVTGGAGTGALSTSVTAGTANCTLAGGVVAARTNGTCVLSIAKLGDTNYNAASATVTLTFAKATAARGTLGSPTSGTAGTGITLSFTGGSGTGAVTYALVSPGTAGCSITNGVLNATTAGKCSVVITKQGDDTYADQVSTVEFTFTAPPSAPQGQSEVAAVTTTTSTTTTTTVAPSVSKKSKVTTTTVADKKVESQTTTTMPPKSSMPIKQLVAPSLVNTPSAVGAATIGGKTLKATTTRVNNQLVFNSGGFTVTLAGVKADGTIIPLSSDGLLEVQRGDTFRLDAEGFAPGSKVDIWMFSKATLMANITVGADGLVKSSFVVPKSMKDGLHHLVMVGVDRAKAEAKFEVGMNVGVPAKQWWASRVLLVIPIAVAVFIGLWLPTTVRRRKRRQEI